MSQASIRRILVVDDEENARLALSRILSREGYDVVSAADGYEALTYLQSGRIHLIITDLNMPGMNGLSFIRELNRTYPDCNVIMMTAYGEAESFMEAMNLGVYEYINKPLKIDELKRIMGRIFTENPN